MQRNIGALDGHEFDLVVIGGGIVGACVARDATLRGFSTALVERGDFSSGTSHNSLKIIHGGLRYVQHLDFRRIRESVAERRFWLTCAANNVRPLKCIMPANGYGTRGPLALAAGFSLYNLLAFGCNRDVPEANHVPMARVLRRESLGWLIEQVPLGKLTGAAQWHDGQMLDANRLIIDFIEDATSEGLTAANYVEATSLVLDENRVAGLDAVDKLTGSPIRIRCKTIVNAAGPWIETILHGVGRSGNGLAWTRGLNLVTRRLFDTDSALALPSNRKSDAVLGKSKRLFFVTPWRGRSIVGTAHLPFSGEPQDYQFSEDEICTFVQEVSAAMPGRRFSRDDVEYVYGGLTPAGENVGGGEVGRERQARIIDHSRQNGVHGLFSVLSIKYTTARHLAERMVDALVNVSDRQYRVCSTATRVLPAAVGFDGEMAVRAPLQRILPGVDSHCIDDLAVIYGAGATRVVKEMLPDHPAHAHVDTSELLRAWCRYSVVREMAMTLQDFLVRRVALSETGALSHRIVRNCADAMAVQLRWSDTKKDREHANFVQWLGRHNRNWCERLR